MIAISKKAKFPNMALNISLSKLKNRRKAPQKMRGFIIPATEFSFKDTQIIYLKPKFIDKNWVI